MPHQPPADEELNRRFKPIFERIAAGAVEREALRRLPLEEAGWLRDAGFGALRVPVELGGSGVSLRQLFALLIDAAAAEPNIVQALRVHYRFLEDRLAERDTERGKRWLRRIGAGSIVGNASTDRAGNIRGTSNARLTEKDSKLLLNGTKYYSTGSLYADYISVAVTSEAGERLAVLIPADAPGVTLLDDYSGFGQRMSASGTSIFTDVEVDPGEVIPFRPHTQHAGSLAVLQLWHLATMAGIAHRAIEDITDFVRRRRRSYSQGITDLPREDPLVQQVVGRIDAAAHAARAIVLITADKLDYATTLRYEFRTAPPELRTEQAEAAVAAAELDAELDVYRAQATVIDLVLHAVTDLFEVGGASALDASLQLDRHWRNARTLASHNPAIYRTRAIGEHLLNGTLPAYVPSVGEAPSVAATAG